MILNNVTTIGGNGPANILIKDGKIAPLQGEPYPGDRQLNFNNGLVFPGLINSHDHLDLNLFPQLGDRTYNNYTEWGNYIHQTCKNEIAAVLKVPLELRVQWGIFKNLLCGVTTVINHGEKLAINNTPITIQQGHSIHSVQFEKKWKLRLNNPLKQKQPAYIHVGEGDDELAANEIDELISWNILNKKLIGVHGVAMKARQAKKFEALVWCPGSNFFMLNKTAPVDQLKEHTKILFGSDSTLTSSWDIWEDIRLARETNLLTDAELYAALQGGDVNATTNMGTIVVKNHGHPSRWDNFYMTQPSDILLVMQGDNIRLFDESLASQLAHVDLKKFSRVNINGAGKYIEGDVPALMNAIKEYYPGAVFPITAN